MALDPITAGIGLANSVVNKIWPDKTEQEKAELAAALAMVQGQMEINKAEAGSSSTFVAGWRPFIGWTCGAAFAWNWVGLPIAMVAASYLGKSIVLEAATMTEMMPVLLGMLGLGGLRSYERVHGVIPKGR